MFTCIKKRIEINRQGRGAEDKGAGQFRIKLIMFSAHTLRRYLRRRYARLAFLLLAASVGFLVSAHSVPRASRPFSPAEDFPRGPLVYAQVKDLPALLKRWEDGSLKDRYLQSTSYRQFLKRHLGLKMAQRWAEFNDALGFTLDPSVFIQSADNRAALAVYDIGHLDLLFVAPLGEEKMAATTFLQNREQFDEHVLPDGTTYFGHAVEADRGRQKQQILFATLHGKLLLATSEGLLLRALANLNGKGLNDRLSDEPAFQSLTARLDPHDATIWVDQAKLNHDWYFKHYWVMKNAGQLQPIRAGIFDLEMQERKWLEHRDFLLTTREGVHTRGIPAPDVKRISALVPDDAPYFRLSAPESDPGQPAALVMKTLVDTPLRSATKRRRKWKWSRDSDADYSGSSDEDDDDYPYGTRHRYYMYLDGDYDRTIDDDADAGLVDDRAEGEKLAAETERQASSALRDALGAGGPSLFATIESPRSSAGPLFTEFRKAVIVTLRSPSRIDLGALERSLAAATTAPLTVPGPAINLNWTDDREDGHVWRRLELPLLGREICYALRDRELMIANSGDLLREMINGKHRAAFDSAGLASSLDELTLVRLDRRKEVFDPVFERLDAESAKSNSRMQPSGAGSEAGQPSQSFFSGTLASLLDVASQAQEMVIKRSSSPGQLHEEVEIILK